MLAPDHVEPGTGEILRLETAESQGALSGKYVVLPGDVVFSKIRPALRKVALANFTGICSADMYPLRPGEEVSGGFVKAVLLGDQFSRYVESLSGRTGIPKVNRGDLQGFWFPVPPLSEQRRIVEVIDSFTELERGVEASIAKFEALRSGLMEELSGLECGQFGEVLKQGPQNGIYKPANSYGLQGTPIVRIDSFSRGKSDLTRGLLRVAVNDGEVSRYGLDVGDIVINRVNTPDLVGKSTSVRRLIESTVFESNMMRCKLRRSLADPVFTETWLESSTAKRYFRARAKSAISQASINGDDVRNCPFPKLDVPGQLAFLERLNAVDDQRLAEEVELAKLRQLKQGLVDDLLSGRVAVPLAAA
ncbi:restriction endonuclease subunit S [Streptomyces griseoaurantiacus]|uniref:restriction endonuclease subunit S n=1 Tax=Streptomyces griseoaurantiacus TaxID=68213 RepID=UPI002E2B5D71|nr:restriction endonuclease subunit S [Streptomyces jietaisiensis]